MKQSEKCRRGTRAEREPWPDWVAGMFSLAMGVLILSTVLACMFFGLMWATTKYDMLTEFTILRVMPDSCTAEAAAENFSTTLHFPCEMRNLFEGADMKNVQGGRVKACCWHSKPEHAFMSYPGSRDYNYAARNLLKSGLIASFSTLGALAVVVAVAIRLG